MSKLDYKRMIEVVDELTSGDALEDYEWKAATNKPFTQSEALHMAILLTRIYSVAHCVHCTACQTKYLEEQR